MNRPVVPEPLVAALQAVAGWLESEHIPYVAIGGIAVSLVARPRATQDIDIAIWLEESRWEGLLESSGNFGFFPRLSDPLEFARRARVILLRHQPTGVSIDISCGALDFEREMIERALSLDLGGLTLRVPTPEDLIVAKAVAHRTKDLADIESIVSVAASLDTGRIRMWVRQFAEALEMPEIYSDIDAMLPREPGTGMKNEE